jgi:ATP-dependent DNA helicase RecG
MQMFFEHAGKTIVALHVPEYPVKPVSMQGRYYVRKRNSNHLMSTSEVVNAHLQMLHSSWDFYPDPTHALDDISLEKVQWGMIALTPAGGTSLKHPLLFLDKCRLLSADNHLTFGAYLLFIARIVAFPRLLNWAIPDQYHHQDRRPFARRLVSQVEHVFCLCQKALNQEVIILGQPESQLRWQYPLEAYSGAHSQHGCTPRFTGLPPIQSLKSTMIELSFTTPANSWATSRLRDFLKTNMYLHSAIGPLPNISGI